MLTGGTIILLAGELKTQFIVHTFLLVERSAFWAKLLHPDSDWKCGTEVDLSDLAVETIAVYISWLYNCQSSYALLAGLQRSSNGTHYKLWSNIFELYIFGHRILDTAFTNAVLDVAIHTFEGKSHLPRGLAQDVYDNTAPACALRRFFVVAWTKTIFKDRRQRKRSLEKILGSDLNCQEFLIDLVAHLTLSEDDQDAQATWSQIGCLYHVHSSKLEQTACTAQASGA